MYPRNERQIQIALNIDDNVQHLDKLRDRRYQYSQLHIRQGYIKYYSSGVVIQTSEGFRRALTRDDKAPMFNTPLVACLSINRAIEPDNKTVFRDGRRVYIPFGVNIQSLKLDGLVYNEFPHDTDFNLINITETVVDFDLKQLRIKGTVTVDFTLETNTHDKLRYFQERIEPLYSHIQKVMVRPDIDLYESDFISVEVLKMAQTLLKNLDLLHSHNFNANRSVRKQLINALIDQDRPLVMPDGTVDLFERGENDVPAKKGSMGQFSAGLYEYKGAYFTDRSDFENNMMMAEFQGQTEDDVIASKKRDNRYAYMMHFLTEQQRIHEITEEEINDPEFVIYAMTEDEFLDYDVLSRGTTDKDKAARLELARAAKLRWKVANGRI